MFVLIWLLPLWLGWCRDVGLKMSGLNSIKGLQSLRSGLAQSGWLDSIVEAVEECQSDVERVDSCRKVAD